jgi:alkylation response protein AidB-like acyl-CoA dehydrogenase
MTRAWDALGPTPAGAEWVERARRLAPRIEAAADEIERARRLPEPLLQALLDAGLYRLLLPRALDGAEVDPLTFVHVIEQLALADASTAWVICQASGCAMTAAYLAPEVARDVFGDRRAILAWGPGPGSRAVVVDGGYRVTGSWSFASGGRHATWLGGFCQIHEADGTPRRRADGGPEIRTMLFPAARAAWRDIWDVIGLRGTGSDGYAVEDLFVPAGYSVSRDDPAERRLGAPLYCFPSGNLYAAGFATVALALARRLLDAFEALATEKTPRGFRGPLRENAVVQSQVAQAEVRLRAARLYLFEAVAQSWRDVRRTGEITVDDRMLIRLASTHAIHEATAVADVAWHAAGASAVFATAPFERRYRDVHTVTQQLQARQAHFETVGAYVLGLEPDLTWL